MSPRIFRPPSDRLRRKWTAAALAQDEAPHFLPMMVRARARRICWRNRAGSAGRPMSRGSVADPPGRSAMSLKPSPVEPVPEATARGRQRSDTTHVLAAIRTLNRLELVGETLRAALNELAAAAPDWLRAAAPRAWYERYALRVEDGRLPRTAAEREAYARTVGEDGFALLDRLDEPEAPEGLRSLPAVGVLRRVWARHFVREGGATPGGGARLRGKGEPPPPETEPVES